MLYSEDRYIVLGGVTLPGAIKKLEVKTSALIEEVEVEGSSAKPKQATGYEDAKINIELILDNTPYDDVETALSDIKKLFRKSKSQTKPKPINIVSTETSLMGVTRVLFKDYSVSRNNKSNQYVATLELWEYIPVSITATKSSTSTKSSTPSLTPSYQSYLQNNRGSVPVTAKSPAKEKKPSPIWMRINSNPFGRSD